MIHVNYYCGLCCYWGSTGHCFKTGKNKCYQSPACEWFFNGSLMGQIDNLAAEVKKLAIANSLTCEEVNRIADSYIEKIISPPKPPTPPTPPKPPSSDSNATFPDRASTPRQRTSGEPHCISCGEELEIKVHGRNKYCGKCGCFLPECVYDQRFTDLVKDVNPMKIIRPSALPTAKCRG